MSNKEILLFFLLFFIVILLFVLIILLIKKKDLKDSSVKYIQNEFFNLNKTFDEKLYFINKMVNENLSKNISLTNQITNNANKTIKEITEKLKDIEETNKQIKVIGKELRGIENILQNPKQRGILGEYFLENILKNILPPENYKMQYKFKNGTIVDAVLFFDKRVLPIDSKFSLENYNKLIEEYTEENRKNLKKDLKNRIDETSKYIKPEEKTLDFAFMFIPSEALYYDLLVNKIGNINNFNLIEYAFKEKKVIIVGPTSFYAYLQTVLQGLKTLKIEKEINDIKIHIIKLEKHLKTYETYFYKVGNSLNISINHFEKAKKEFEEINKNIISIKK